MDTDLCCSSFVFRWCVAAHRLQLQLLLFHPQLSVLTLRVEIVRQSAVLRLPGCLQNKPPLLLGILQRQRDLSHEAPLQLLT